MICIDAPFPKNCTVCQFNVQGCCIASGIVSDGETMIYRDIDTDFGEGTDGRPEWCNIYDDGAVIKKMLNMITIEDAKALEELGKNRNKVAVK